MLENYQAKSTRETNDEQKKGTIDWDKSKVRFEVTNLERKGPLNDVDQNGDIIIISWNVDHPFYTEVIQNNPILLNGIGSLVYAFAITELKTEPGSDLRQYLEIKRYLSGYLLSDYKEIKRKIEKVKKKQRYM